MLGELAQADVMYRKSLGLSVIGYAGKLKLNPDSLNLIHEMLRFYHS
jgi:hypothetical protein